MPTYTVKTGDTKSKLEKELGLSVSDTQYRSTDPNKLFAGEVLTLPEAQGPVQSFIGPVQDGAVDLSKVQGDVQTFEEPAQITSDRDVTSALVETGRLQEAPTSPFVSVEAEKISPEEQLLKTSQNIQSEITALEEKMAGQEGVRTGELESEGVFEDLRTLNELKAELREAEDRSIEIPIEARQELRGKQATKTEFAAATGPELEKAALSELVASRRTSRLTDTINTNIAVIDQRLDADNARDEFLYTQKQQRLEKIESIYGDIMTEKQKQVTADKKLENDLTLEDRKSDNALKSDLLKGLAEKGLSGESYMSMSIGELLAEGNSVVSPMNWSNLSLEDAAVYLDADTFKNKFVPMYDRRKTESDEQIEFDNQATAVTMGAQSVIDTLELLLSDDLRSGLENSVGTFLGSTTLGEQTFKPLSLATGGLVGAGTAISTTDETNKFRANLKKLLSEETLQQLIELKKAGGTLGAISEKELAMLENAAVALGSITDDGKSTGRSNFSEEDFVEALKVLRIGSMKTYVAGSMGEKAFADGNFKHAEFDVIEKLYQDIKTNGYKSEQTDFAEQDFSEEQNLEVAFDQIRQEEGLRLDAYQDSTGTWTLGFGNTQIGGRAVQQGDSLTKEQAESLMQKSVVENYTTFADKISSDITPNQFAALTSFEYNLGPGVWNSSTGQQILQLIDSGDYNAAGQLMLQYNKSQSSATGQLEVNEVLTQRRVREANLLLS